MDWFRTPTRAEDANRASQESFNELNERPGKFQDLSEFMRIEPGCIPRDIPANRADIEPGHIIYIRDKAGEDSRVNRRVMLVLFLNQAFSYTCLSFCSHPDFDTCGETLHNNHALVCADRLSQGSPDRAPAQQRSQCGSTLSVNLHGANYTSCALQPHIYLNLREHWQVEREGRLVILGRAERESYQKLIPTITCMFDMSVCNTEFAGGNVEYNTSKRTIIVRSEVPTPRRPPGGHRRDSHGRR